MKIETKDGGLYCTKDSITDVVKAEGDSNDIILLVSTEAIDSDGDIVHQRKSKRGAGWVLDRFNKAPVITWQHDIWTPNLSGPKTKAKVQKHATKGQGLHLIPLTFDQEDAFAAAIEGKIRRDVIKESSVGFKILVREQRKSEEGRTIGLDIYEQELIEAAIANRGANPETEVMAKRMLSRPDVAQEVEGAGSAIIDELKDEIEELSQKFVLLSNAIKSLGDEAQAQEVLRKQEDLKNNDAEIKAAAREMLKTLQAVGTAR